MQNMSSPSAHHLFPSAIVCSCGKRFDSDWSGSASLHRRRLASVGSALWLFLRHRSARLASRGSTKRPHCCTAVLFQCLYCQNSIDISDYRQHLFECSQDAHPAAAVLAQLMQVLGDVAKSEIPSFDCYECQRDDDSEQLDLGAVLEHSHLSFYEPCIRCRECRLRVPLCDAVGHAAFWHSDRLRSPSALADLFVTTPSTLLSQGVSSNSAPLCWEIEQSDAPDQVETYGPLLESSDSSLSGSVRMSNTVSQGEQVTDSIAESTMPVEIQISECEVCGATFDSPSGLQSHARKHSPPRRFPCRECSASYASVLNLDYHIRRTHVGECRYECDECGRRFFWKHEFTHHMLLHTGERPYHCEKCQLTYPSKQKLKRHVARRHGVGGRVPIKRTRRKPMWLFPCDQCDKVYNTKQNLKRHRFTHTGERPFRCPLCDMALFRQDQLKQHMLSHGNVRSFRCDVCDDKAFITQGNLKQHKGTRAHKVKESEQRSNNATSVIAPAVPS